MVQGVMVYSMLTKAESLHPHIITSFQDITTTEPQCTYHIIYKLPPSVFVDPYQLADMEKQIGQSMVFGEIDLEAPLENVKDMRGSLVILRNATFSRVDLPIHARYQRPSLTLYRQVALPSPSVGLTCHRLSYASPPDYPPISDVLLPYTDIDSTFHLISSGDAMMTFKLPVGQSNDSLLVSMGTCACVLFCTLWITLSVWRALEAKRRRDEKGKRRRSD